MAKSVSSVTAAVMLEALFAYRDPERATDLQRYFRTGPGEYGHGDVFLGLQVPTLRRLVPDFVAAPLAALRQLLASDYHEVRLLALLIMVQQYAKAAPAVQDRLYRLYLSQTRRINSWDLVDLSAPAIVGAHVGSAWRKVLPKLARSAWLWDRRIAIVATHWLIRQHRFMPTLTIARQLLADPHDLIHKATGWMLREVGKRDPAVLVTFLRQHHAAMPRTALRYAIERFPPQVRKAYLAGHF